MPTSAQAATPLGDNKADLEEGGLPITATVISNVRGRSIIASSREGFGNVNGSHKDYEMPVAVQTEGTD